MEWDDREMRETSVGKRRKRASEVRSDQMDIDGEREEEDAGQEKKRVKLSVGPVAKGKGRAVSSDGEEKERSCMSSVMGKGKSKRKRADHVEDEDAILQHSSYPLIVDLLQMHLHFRVLSRISRVPPLFLDTIHVCPPSFPPSPSYLLLRPLPQGQLQ